MMRSLQNMAVGTLKVTLVVLMVAGSSAQAQSVIDGSDAAIGAENTTMLLALIGRRLRSSDAKVAGLHKGRADALCGTVEVRNRMGNYTGPRGFVADLPRDIFGRLPEGPELRSPASMADYRAMEQAKALFAENCIDQ